MSNVTMCLCVLNLDLSHVSWWGLFLRLGSISVQQATDLQNRGEFAWNFLNDNVRKYVDLVVFNYRFPWLVQVAHSYSGETGQGQPGWQPMINIENRNVAGRDFVEAGHLLFGGTFVPLLQHKMWNYLKKRSVCDKSPIWMSASGKPRADVRQFLKSDLNECIRKTSGRRETIFEKDSAPLFCSSMLRNQW